ncbi:MAG: metallophosphoesterase family protein [Patescibacteria group bacterium]
MKLFVIADRPPRRPIRAILSENQVDAICTLGDLTLQDIRQLEDVAGIPKVGVYGNHDSGTYMSSLGIENLHLATATVKGIVFGGFQGSVRYKPGEHIMYTQEQAMELLVGFPHVDVMLTHAPPYGIHDEPDDPVHQGFRALNDYIAVQHPRYLLHGHTYAPEHDRTATVGSTKVIFVYQDAIVDIV